MQDLRGIRPRVRSNVLAYLSSQHILSAAQNHESHATSPPRLNGLRRLTGTTGVNQRLADSRAQQ